MILGATAFAVGAPVVGRCPPDPLTIVNVRIVQPNIGQQDKWRPGFEPGGRAPPRHPLRPAERRAAAAAVAGGRDHRSARGRPNRRAPGAGGLPAHARGVAARARRPAADRRNRDRLERRSPRRSARRTAFTRSGTADGFVGRYDKAHLVPYGEYLPMRPLLSAIGLSRLAPGDIDFNAGPGAAHARPRRHWGKVGFQLCYEIIFSGHVVDERNRPDFIFNPSNDAWFGKLGPAAAPRPGAPSRGRGRHSRAARDTDRHQRGDRRPRQCRQSASVAHRRGDRRRASAAADVADRRSRASAI